ncbi:MAG: hypothetical protein KDC44_10490, partial [Phaeodactylibacter sp.]|nr:hypothetical protein [Phaeodactylibacter sp.]
MTRFCHFALSPYHNKHQAVQQLVGYLNGIYPKFEGAAVSVQTLSRETFGKVQPSSKLAVVVSYTQRLLEAFLAQESFAEAPLDQQLRLVQALRHKGQRPLYQKELTRLQEQILAAPYQDSQT